MPTLDTAQLAAIADNRLWHALITEITVEAGDVIRLTNNYFNLDIGGNTYIANSELQQPANTKNNTMTNNSTTNISIGLLDTTMRNRVLSADIIGSRIVISRVFIDEDAGTVIGDPLPRIQGLIFAYEVRDTNSADGTLQPFRASLDIRPDTSDLLTIPNLATNSQSQQRFAPTDNIFSLVEASANKNIILT